MNYEAVNNLLIVKDCASCADAADGVADAWMIETGGSWHDSVAVWNSWYYWCLSGYRIR